jgi:hypothetical protein
MPLRRQGINCTTEHVDDRVETIVRALKRKQRVVVRSTEPIEELARVVWARLPGRVRCRAAVATWAFRNDNGFDLLAVPRLAGITIDAADLVLDPASRGIPTATETATQTLEN